MGPRSVVRPHDSVAAMLCKVLYHVSDRGRSAICNYLLETVDKAKESAIRVSWVIAVPCVVALQVRRPPVRLRVRPYIRTADDRRMSPPPPPGPPPPPTQTQVRKNGIYNRENLVRPFWVPKNLGRRTAPTPLPRPSLLKVTTVTESRRSA